MNSEIVNPMPDSAAPPATCGIRSPGARLPGRRRANRAVAAVMPTNLPRTRPSTTPQVNGEVRDARSVSAVRGTPALASANTGTMMNAV